MTSFCMVREQKFHSLVQKAFERKCGIIDKNWMSYAFFYYLLTLKQQILVCRRRKN